MVDIGNRNKLEGNKNSPLSESGFGNPDRTHHPEDAKTAETAENIQETAAAREGLEVVSKELDSARLPEASVVAVSESGKPVSGEELSSPSVADHAEALITGDGPVFNKDGTLADEFLQASQTVSGQK